MFQGSGCGSRHLVRVSAIWMVLYDADVCSSCMHALTGFMWEMDGQASVHTSDMAVGPDRGDVGLGWVIPEEPVSIVPNLGKPGTFYPIAEYIDVDPAAYLCEC
jgi:hypothetical protein